MNTKDIDYALVGDCPICGQGRQFITKERHTDEYYVMCEDCESEWVSPVECDSINKVRRENHGPSDFVTLTSINLHSWKEHVKNLN